MASKILIVEDNLMNRALFRVVLLSYGFEIVEAENGAEGVKAAREQRPDLILMDLQMPVMNGYEAAKILRDEPTTSKIPLVVVTAFAMNGDREKVLASGFDRYISKPFIGAELSKIIRELLATGQRSE
ncbi:MAG: response regulator [Desulfuromonadales bacterium]|nr:response regulator [Desulfuromonadales bacterium]